MKFDGNLLICQHCMNILEIQKKNMKVDSIHFTCDICNRISEFKNIIFIYNSEELQNIITDKNLVDQYESDKTIMRTNDGKNIIMMDKKNHYIIGDFGNSCKECDGLIIPY